MSFNTENTNGMTNEEVSRRAVYYECVKILKEIIRPGDRIGCTKCPGTKRVFTFKEWDGMWLCSATGINDYSPVAVYSINGRLTNIKAMAIEALKCT